MKTGYTVCHCGSRLWKAWKLSTCILNIYSNLCYITWRCRNSICVVRNHFGVICEIISILYKIVSWVSYTYTAVINYICNVSDLSSGTCGITGSIKSICNTDKIVVLACYCWSLICDIVSISRNWTAHVVCSICNLSRVIVYAHYSTVKSCCILRKCSSCIAYGWKIVLYAVCIRLKIAKCLVNSIYTWLNAFKTWGKLCAWRSKCFYALSETAVAAGSCAECIKTCINLVCTVWKALGSSYQWRVCLIANIDCIVKRSRTVIKLFKTWCQIVWAVISCKNTWSVICDTALESCRAVLKCFSTTCYLWRTLISCENTCCVVGDTALECCCTVLKCSRTVC